MAHPKASAASLAEFLKPLQVTTEQVVSLSRQLHTTFRNLAATSSDQFLPTPISESILRPAYPHRTGHYFAIDIGGTNLRAGWVELLPEGSTVEAPAARSRIGVRAVRLRERSWPIGEHLKRENAESLFGWIGECIATVIRDELTLHSPKGLRALQLDEQGCIPMGVAFSFPMSQHGLADATLMAMGKGFAISSQVDLGHHLTSGYDRARARDTSLALPPIRIVAIANDSVATLVSFMYQFEGGPRSKAAMGLICGTGSNATIPFKVESLHAGKRPATVSSIATAEDAQEGRIAVNTEWSINGSAPPLRKLGLVTKWDEQLDAAGEAPGFQPLEYMTAGRYLGELGRLILVDWLTGHVGVDIDSLPQMLRMRFGLTTTFLSHFRPKQENSLVDVLNTAFPTDAESAGGFVWTEDVANALYEIAKAIERRAAGIVAAATIGLLASAEDLVLPSAMTNGDSHQHRNGDLLQELAVGYTGGCIVHFQDYRRDCQQFLDDILAAEYGGKAPVRVELYPCHDGGILGAGILVPAALASQAA
jgi:hexokinase